MVQARAFQVAYDRGRHAISLRRIAVERSSFVLGLVTSTANEVHVFSVTYIGQSDFNVVRRRLLLVLSTRQVMT